LQIPENYVGQLVQCPDCQHQFQAALPSAAVQSSAPAPAKSEPPAPSEENRRRADEDDLDRLSRRRRKPDDDDDNYNDDNDRDDVNISRGRVWQQQHRGAIVLMLGILSICCIGAPITGVVAWILGHLDLKEMDAGRMDPTGRGQTQTGKVLGMISVILTGLFILGYCLIGFFVAGLGAIQGPRRRR
jgi:hypothetical protein